MDVYEKYLKEVLNKLGKLDDIDEKINNLLSDVKCIDRKVDSIASKINSIVNEFESLKKENRDIEEKISLISYKLDNIQYDEESMADYYKLSQSLYDNWDKLDKFTKEVIPIAEFMLSQLQRKNCGDYSPVIIQFCRALENELLLKVFKKYTFDLINRKNNDLDDFLCTDKSSDELKNKTQVFLKKIVKASRKKEAEFTLGEMNMILSISTEQKVLNLSPLLKDFVNYLKKNKLKNDLLARENIKQLDYIVEEYRNPSAHPNQMPYEKEIKCKELMPDRLDYLTDCTIS